MKILWDIYRILSFFLFVPSLLISIFYIGDDIEPPNILLKLMLVSMIGMAGLFAEMWVDMEKDEGIF
jgi:uncharacterized membrane protein